MKKLFLEFRKKVTGSEDFSVLDSLEGKTVSIAGTIQYLDFIPSIKKYLESLGKKVLIKKGAFHPGHVIGCNPSAFDVRADTLLLLADGKFHATNNALILNREIFVFNLNKLEKLSLQDLEKYKNRTNAKKSKFLHSTNVGLIVSTKYGQNFKGIKQIQERIEKLKKNVFLFETDNITLNDLENFPDIELWINTACYGLGLDDPKVVNLQDLLEFI